MGPPKSQNWIYIVIAGWVRHTCAKLFIYFKIKNSNCPCITLCNIFGHGVTPCNGYTQCLCNTINIHRSVLQNSLPKKNSKAWEQSTIKNKIGEFFCSQCVPIKFLRFSYPQILSLFLKTCPIVFQFLFSIVWPWFDFRYLKGGKGPKGRVTNKACL